ncbi:thermonuclease family protein [Rhizobiaceae bacterium]|nr:thermonuclease family protein [Rhizobiaceae bacterium]
MGRALIVLLGLWVAPALAEDASPVVIAKCGLYAYAAHITEVYDGDTVTANVDLGFKTWRMDEKLRLYGIDAPEMRGAEREAGLVSRDALRAKILERDVTICTYKDTTGKYGRYLADIYLGDENVNAWLIAEGFAEPYGEPAKADGTGLAWPRGWFGMFNGPRFEPAALPDPR